MKMDCLKTKFSVLMSVYEKDSPEFLKTALESIYENQTKKPDEIVVVFDGPLTPELYPVLENFRKGKEDFVRFCPLESNKGLGSALKIGTDFCSGDYILRMDSDDISAPERFEKQMLFAEENPQIDVFGTDIGEFVFDFSEKKRVRSCPAEHGAIVRMCKRRSPFNHMSVCIKKSSLLKCGGYEPLLFLEDYYLWARMISCGCRFGNINEVLVFARTGKNFYSRRNSREVFESRKSLQKYMVGKKLITPFEAFENLAAAGIFMLLPETLKKFIYKFFLRNR